MLLMQGRLPANLIAEMILGGEPIDSAEAQRIGLVNALMSADDFAADCERFMQRFTRMSRPVLGRLSHFAHFSTLAECA